MAYNHGREERKWRIWKENEEKILRECGVDEGTIEEIRTYDRAEFNSNRRFYRWTNDVAEYLEEMADREPQAEFWQLMNTLYEVHAAFKKCVPYYPYAAETCKEIEEFILELQQAATSPQRFDVEEMMKTNGDLNSPPSRSR